MSQDIEIGKISSIAIETDRGYGRKFSVEIKEDLEKTKTEEEIPIKEIVFNRGKIVSVIEDISKCQHNWQLKFGSDTGSCSQCIHCKAYKIEDNYPL
jgi:hypothetical protein